MPNPVRQYIGARYTIKVYENSLNPASAEWEAGRSWEPLVMVTYNNSSYLSKRDIPSTVGNPASNPTYWALTGAYNGQILDLQNRVSQLENDVGGLTTRMLAAEGSITSLQTDMTWVKNNLHPRKFLIMADSYGTFDHGGNHYSWVDDVISRTGINGVNLSQGDIGFRPEHGLIGSFTSVLTYAVNNHTIGNLSEYTDLIVGGGANDIASVRNGEVTKATLISEIGDFITYVRANFPNVKRIAIGMVGNLRNPNNAWNWNQVVEAYRSAVDFGAEYLNNVEYILQPRFILSDDGIHPTATGFDELGKYMVPAVLSNSCDVERAVESFNLTGGLDPTVGSWNLLPEFYVSQHNGQFKICVKRMSCTLTLESANRLDVTSITPSRSVDKYKLFEIGKTLDINTKGGNYDIQHQVEYTEPIQICLYTVTSKFITLETPLAIIQGVYYLCIPNDALLLRNLTNGNENYNAGIYTIEIEPFDITVDTSNYNGITASP